MPWKAVAIIVSGLVGAVAAAIPAWQTVYEWMSAGLSLELRDAKTTLQREENGANITYYVLLSGEMVILNNNSRHVLIRNICVQKYDHYILRLSKNSHQSCATTELIGQDGASVHYPITVAAYDRLLLKYEEAFPVYNHLIATAYEALLARGWTFHNYKTTLKLKDLIYLDRCAG